MIRIVIYSCPTKKTFLILQLKRNLEIYTKNKVKKNVQKLLTFSFAIQTRNTKFSRKNTRRFSIFFLPFFPTEHV